MQTTTYGLLNVISPSTKNQEIRDFSLSSHSANINWKKKDS